MSDRFTVEVKGLDGLTEQVRGVVGRVLELFSFALQAEIVREEPIDKGYLRSSTDLPEQLGEFAWGITIGAEYWRAVQFGSKPHVITAKQAGQPYDILPVKGEYLRFEIGGKVIFTKAVRNHPNPGYLAFKIGGKLIFRHSVNHPGTKANPFIDRAITTMEGRIDGIVTAALREVGL